VINRILALVDGDPITLYELKDFAAGDPRLKSALPSHQGDVLDLLITKRLIDKEVEKQGIKVQDADIDHYIANIKDRNHITDEQLDAALAQQGLTRDRYRAQVREELQRAQLINREIRGKVSVSDADIERYRKEHGSEGESASSSADSSTDEQVTISQIFLKIPSGATLEQQAAVQAHADKIYDELKGGADFAALATSESEDGAGKSGGKLGTFKEGEMRDDLAAAIKGLKPGEFTKPVHTSSGIHIVRVDARTGPGAQKAVADDGKTDEIKEQLYAKALEDRYNRWLKEDLRQRHHVEIRP
jgi:peptidyl-prolyl cis-trans isomerase SurA